MKSLGRTWNILALQPADRRVGADGWGTALQADGVIGIFHWSNPSGRTMTLGSTQPQTETSSKNISWGVKAAGA